MPARTPHRRILLLAVVAALAASPVSGSIRFTPHLLPELPGDVSSEALVAGFSRSSLQVQGDLLVGGASISGGGTRHAVVWNYSQDLGASTPVSLLPITPGAPTEVRGVHCWDGTCRATGTENEPGNGQAPRVWTGDGTTWSPAVSLTCPAQSQPASSDVGRSRGVIITIQGSSFGNTACGRCDDGMGAVGAVTRAAVWEEQGGAWVHHTLPALSALSERSSDAVALYYVESASTHRLGAVGWAEDDLGARTPVLWEKENGTWTLHVLPLPQGSRGGEVADVALTPHGELAMCGTRSQDDGTLQSFVWRQTGGPFVFAGTDLPPLQGYDASSATTMIRRRGASRASTISSSFCVTGTSSSNGGLPDEGTLWEVFPLTVEARPLSQTITPVELTLAVVRDLRDGAIDGADGTATPPPHGARVFVGSADVAGTPAGGAGPEGTETHAVLLEQVEPAPGLMPLGITLALGALAGIGALVLRRRRTAVA